MTSKRSDVNTPLKKQQEYYSDFHMNFEPHPITGDIVRLTNESAVKQSLKNLILTNLGERGFRNGVGGNVSHSLFEPFGQFTADDLKYQVKKIITDFEGERVALLDVVVAPSMDLNGYQIGITFGLVSSPDPVRLEMILKRVR